MIMFQIVFLWTIYKTGGLNDESNNMFYAWFQPSRTKEEKHVSYLIYYKHVHVKRNPGQQPPVKFSNSREDQTQINILP